MYYVLELKLENVATVFWKTAADLITKVTHYMVSKTRLKVLMSFFPVMVSHIYKVMAKREYSFRT